MMFFRSFSVVSLLSLMILLAGCSDDPSTVGSSLLPSEGAFQIVDTILYAASDTMYSTPMTTGQGTNLLVGTWNGFNAVTVINFSTASLADTLRDARIDTAQIVFTTSYLWNYGASQNDYFLRPIRTAWTESFITRDSIDKIWNSLGQKCGSNRIATTIGSQTIFTIDTNVVRQWLAVKPDSTNFYGFALIDSLFDNGVTTSANGILGVYAFRTVSPPHLIVTYTRGGVQNTIDVSIGDDAFLATGPLQTGTPKFMETQGGISIRSKMMFDISSIPRASIVNNAVLEIVQKEKNLGFGTPDSVVAFAGTDALRPEQLDETYYTFGYRRDTTTSVYTCTLPYLNHIVQRWINGSAVNAGLVLRSASDGYSMDKTIFYSSSDADVSKRPRLRITYTKK